MPETGPTSSPGCSLAVERQRQQQEGQISSTTNGFRQAGIQHPPSGPAGKVSRHLDFPLRAAAGTAPASDPDNSQSPVSPHAAVTALLIWGRAWLEWKSAGGCV